MPEQTFDAATVPGTDGTALSAEDTKLVTLARSSRARVGAVEGAAVRDQDGRTYAAATVTLPSLAVTALQLAVAQAVSSGATSIEAAAVVTESPVLDGGGRAAVRDLATDAPIHVAGPDGALLGTVTQ
ncbi:cytidine deaminase [Actinoplanes sp. NPDC051861]|uniref:cytidine deaminase n=1 Tax=Actinoplanes sp. NPDC051861 TaxID=3155170 RepID=UPI003426EE30